MMEWMRLGETTDRHSEWDLLSFIQRHPLPHNGLA